MKLYKELGFYLPSFFMVQINDKNSTRTFTHELIHFLQDISTTYGLINISKTVDEIKELNRLFLAGIPKSNILFEQSDEYKINRDVSLSIKGVHNGMYKEFDTNTKVISFTCLETRQIKSDILNNNIQLFEISVEIEDSTNGYYDSFSIGSIAIIESMTNILENHLFGKKQGNRSYPYDIITMREC